MLGRIFANLFSNVFAWLQAVGVGAVIAIQQYVHMLDTADTDPLSALIKGAIVMGLVKLFGAIIKAKQPA